MSDSAWQAQWERMQKQGRVERESDIRRKLWRTPVLVRSVSTLHNFNDAGRWKQTAAKQGR
jgi:hypothetical protein